MPNETVKRNRSKRGPADLRTAFQRCVVEILRLSSELESAATNASKPFGISIARWSILGTLNMHGPRTVADISRELGLRRQSVQQTVNHMRTDGLLEAMPNPRHKRAPLIRMTRAGEKVMAELLIRQRMVAKLFTANCALSAADFDEITRKLRLVRLPERGEDDNG